MALESAVYIDTLNVSNPSGSDGLGQADDHIRMLKAVLKNTFPNLNSVVSATPLQLNQSLVPTGLIAMWSGDPGSLPAGWRLCDGGTYAKSDGSGNITAPDLRNRFILAAGATTAAPSSANTVNSYGGSSTSTPTIHVADHAIQVGHLPSYNLPIYDPGHGHTCWVSEAPHTHGYNGSGYMSIVMGTTVVNTVRAASAWENSAGATTGISVGANSNGTGIAVGSGGGNWPLGHSAWADPVSIIPTYYVLAFIIKV